MAYHQERWDGWRPGVEAVASWTYWVYPKTTGSQASPGKAAIESWWATLSKEGRREALTTSHSGVIGVARAMARQPGMSFAIATARRGQHAYRPVARRPGIDEAEKAARAIVTGSVVRWDATRGPKDVCLEADEDDADDDCALSLLVDGRDELQLIDAVAGGRAFSWACTAQTAEDPWCRAAWFKAEQGRGAVSAGQFLANVAEGLIWRAFWRANDRSRRPKPPRHRNDDDLDAWWHASALGEAAVGRALAHAFKAVKGLAKQRAQKRPVAALRGLVACVDTAVARLSGRFIPSRLSDARLDESRLAGWFGARLRLGFEELRCQATMDALLASERRLAPAAVSPAAKKRGKAKKARKERAPAPAPPLEEVAKPPVDNQHRAASTIARRWRRYNSLVDLVAAHDRARRPASTSLEPRLRSRSAGNHSQNADPEPRSCPTSPKARRSPPPPQDWGPFSDDNDDADSHETPWKRVASSASAAGRVGSKSTNGAKLSDDGSHARDRQAAKEMTPRPRAAGRGTAATAAKALPQPATTQLGCSAPDLNKTAEETTSYSDALKKNIVLEPLVEPPRKHKGDDPPLNYDLVDETSEDIILRLARANLALRRDNLKLQAEVSRLHGEVAAHRGGAATLPSYLRLRDDGQPQQQYPCVYADADASVSSETRQVRHLPRRQRRPASVDDDTARSLVDGEPRVLAAVAPTFTPPSTVTAPFTPSPPSVPAANAPYYVYYGDTSGFFDVASDDGRRTIHSDTSPPFFAPRHTKPLEAVRECAVLLPAQRPSPGEQACHPRFVVDSCSRGSSSVAACDKRLVRVVTSSIDDAYTADGADDDDFSQPSSENNGGGDDDDEEKWATTTTRGSGKPPSDGAHLQSLEDELRDDMLSASSHSSLASNPRCDEPTPTLARAATSKRSNLQADHHAVPAARMAHKATPQQHRRAVTNRVCKRIFIDETLFSTSSRLADDVRVFAERVSRRQRARESAWRAARELVRDVARALWPRARVEPYGSCVTRLSLANASSDLDLVIRLPRVRLAAPAMTPGDLEGRNAVKETWPQELARRLRSEAWVEPDSVQTIASTLVPIVKLVTVPLGETDEPVRLDVSFEGPGHHGLEANKLVAKMLDDSPGMLRPLLLVLKQHAAERGLCASYTGGLSSYALTLLVARYLHEQPVDETADPGALLLGFLDFYAHKFDARKTGVSVARGCFFARADLGSRHYAAATGFAAMGRNHEAVVAHNTAAHLARAFHFDPIYIEDPLSPGNNVGRNCFRIAQIQRAWSDAFASLSEAIAKNTRWPPHRTTPARPNLLSSIFSVPNDDDCSTSAPSSGAPTDDTM